MPTSSLAEAKVDYNTMGAYMKSVLDADVYKRFILPLQRIPKQGTLPAGYLSFGPIEENIMIFVTSACARWTGAAGRMSEGDVSAEHCLQCEAGELAGVTRAASQAFERMHNTLSQWSKT